MRDNSAELRTGNINSLFGTYFTSSFAGALVIAIYSLADAIMVGQYEGPAGTAAIACVMPIWNIILSIGMLFGLGGAVLMSTSKGSGHETQGNGYWTVALLAEITVTAVISIGIGFFQEPILRLFGADDELLPLALKYLNWVAWSVPLFMIGKTISAFIANDGSPVTVSVSVLIGGSVNIVGDWFLVFILDMGIEGAGIATSLGQVVNFIGLTTHFFRKKCGLRLVKPTEVREKLRRITSTGFSTFIVDISLGIVTLVFNRQVMRYYDGSVLAVYGIISNVVMVVQAMAYAVGQAAQPIISVNYGAASAERIHKVARISTITSFVIGTGTFILTAGFPEAITNIFMSGTEAVMGFAPRIMRIYFSSFLLMGFNVFVSYYFQAILESRKAIVISLLRSLILCIVFLYGLPFVMGAEGIWWTMPFVEAITFIVCLFMMRAANRRLESTMAKDLAAHAEKA